MHTCIIYIIFTVWVLLLATITFAASAHSQVRSKMSTDKFNECQRAVKYFKMKVVDNIIKVIRGRQML